MRSVKFVAIAANPAAAWKIFFVIIIFVNVSLGDG